MVCKEVGHLKKSCPGKSKKQSAWKEEWLEHDPVLEIYDEKGPVVLDGDSHVISMNSASFIGKLKIFSPALFSSLSMKEMEWLQRLFSDITVRSEPSVNFSKSEIVKQRVFGSGFWVKGCFQGKVTLRVAYLLKKGEWDWRGRLFLWGF
jgi:hypothetical protein